MRLRERERYNTLSEVRDLVRRGNWVVLDLETTSLEGEAIQWAVAAPDGTILGQGFIKPTRPITEGARAVHGIQDAQVAEAPTFAEVWPTLWTLLAGRTVVAYNASFDEARLHTSSWPYFCFLRGEPKLSWFCAMEAFAAAYGAWHDYFKSYTWQTLETACHFFRLSHDQAHSAAGDASSTALVMQAMAQMAEKELPEGYHLPIGVPCSGGCGKTKTHRYGDEGDGRWYCGPCGVRAGVFHRCPGCQQHWAIVYTANAEELCETCHEARALERGDYHRCLGCGGVVKAPEREQKYHNKTCQRRAARRRREQREEALPEGATPVRAGNHQLEAIHDGHARLRCSVCQQTWTNGVRSVCPGVVTFSSWEAVPKNYVTWTELCRQHFTTSRSVPHAAVRVLKAPYFRYVYDLERSTPVLISPERQAAIEKAKATTQARCTCQLCQTYSPSPKERQAFVAQVCGRCQWDIRSWNERVAWAQDMVQKEAVLLEVQTQVAGPDRPAQPVACTILDLASGTMFRSGAIGPADAPALAELLDHPPTPVLTWNGEGLWPLRDWAESTSGQIVFFGRMMERLSGQLTHARQGDRVVAWSARPYQNGSPTDDLAWYCAAYGVEAGLTRLETMRRLVLHLAAEAPLVLEQPEKERRAHARTA